jgi:hypothetical protein
VQTVAGIAVSFDTGTDLVTPVRPLFALRCIEVNASAIDWSFTRPSIRTRQISSIVDFD